MKKYDYSNDFVHWMNVRGVQNRPVTIMNCLLMIIFIQLIAINNLLLFCSPQCKANVNVLFYLKIESNLIIKVILIKVGPYDLF